jgi:rod shape determining protein RodA
MIRRRPLDLPWLVPLSAAALVALGILFVRSSTAGTDLEGLERRQLRVVLASLPALVLLAFMPVRRLARLAFALDAAGLAALAAVLFVGVTVGGARRWFDTPIGLRLQPSELMKPLLVLALARWLEFRPRPERLRDWAVPGALTLLPFALIEIEPDLGTALLLLPIAAAILFAAGARIAHLGAAALAGAVLLPAVALSPLLADYQRARIETYLTSVPDLAERVGEARRNGDDAQAAALARTLAEHKRGEGWQSYCAQVSIGSGGLLGKGLGEGPQNRLSFLPARHTDFIFAVIGEEWGLAGACGVLALYLLLGFSLLSIAAGTRDRFSQLVCVGAAAALVPQALGNIAVACGLVPVTGIPLPLVSQGGSSVLSSFALIGIACAAARSRRTAEPFLHSAGEPVDPFDARQAAEPLRDVPV